MAQLFAELVNLASGISIIIGLLCVLIRPIRDKLFKGKLRDEGIKCLLRERMLKVYYDNYENKTLKEYQAQSIAKMYEAYKGLNGNSFIDKIYDEMSEWTIIK